MSQWWQWRCSNHLSWNTAFVGPFDSVVLPTWGCSLVSICRRCMSLLLSVLLCAHVWMMHDFYSLIPQSFSLAGGKRIYIYKTGEQTDCQLLSQYGPIVQWINPQGDHPMHFCHLQYEKYFKIGEDKATYEYELHHISSQLVQLETSFLWSVISH